MRRKTRRDRPRSRRTIERDAARHVAQPRCKILATGSLRPCWSFSIPLRSRHRYIIHTWGLILRWVTSTSCEYCGICSASQSERLAGPLRAESLAGNRAVSESDTEPKLAPLGLRTTLAAKMRQHFLREQLHTRGNLGRIGARPLDGIASDGVTHNPSPGGQQCDGVCAGPASASSRAFFAHRHDSKSIGVAARPQLKT
jgi:hypothetical protein